MFNSNRSAIFEPSEQPEFTDESGSLFPAVGTPCTVESETLIGQWYQQSDGLCIRCTACVCPLSYDVTNLKCLFSPRSCKVRSDSALFCSTLECRNKLSFSLCAYCAIPAVVKSTLSRYNSLPALQLACNEIDQPDKEKLGFFQPVSTSSAYAVMFQLINELNKLGLGADLRKISFLEIGMGKGHVGLVASFFFGKVVGIECQPTLCKRVFEAQWEQKLFTFVIVNENLIHLSPYQGNVIYCICLRCFDLLKVFFSFTP